MHYKRWDAHGDVSADRPPQTRYSDPETTFLSCTEMEGDCLVWTRQADTGGYGRIWIGGQSTAAHRYAWERVNGPIPDGMLVDHRFHCDRRCVTVAHLRLATRGENTINRAGPTKNNPIGVRNVHRKRDRWAVTLQKEGRVYRYGVFDTVAEAAVVAERARQEVFGEWAGRG